MASTWFGVFVATGAVLAFSCRDVHGQSTPVPDLHRGTVEVVWHFAMPSLPSPEADLDRVRARAGSSITLSKGGPPSEMTWHEFGARVYWTRLLSTMAQGRFTTWGQQKYSIDYPPGSFLAPQRLLSHEVHEHRRAFSIVQSVDLPRIARIVPWAGAGVTFYATTRREQGSGFRNSYLTRLATSQKAAVVTGGIRIYVDQWELVSLSVLDLLGEIPSESVGVQVGYGLSF